MGFLDSIKGLAAQVAPHVPGGSMALGVVNAAAPVAAGIYNKVQARLNRAPANRAATVSAPAAAKRARNAVRAVKTPLVHRIQIADEGRNEVAKIAAVQPRAPHTIPLLAGELAHAGGQLRKLTEDLVDQGAMATGDWKTDVSNGVLLVNSQKIDLTSILATLSIAKSLEMRAPTTKPSSAPSGLLDRIAEAGSGPSEPLLAFRGMRRTGADAEKRREGDMCGFVISSGQVIAQDSSPNAPSWPANTLVFEGVAPRFVPNLETAATLAGTLWAWTRQEWYLKALAVLPESIKNVFKKGSGLGDFRLGWGE